MTHKLIRAINARAHSAPSMAQVRQVRQCVRRTPGVAYGDGVALSGGRLARGGARGKRLSGWRRPCESARRLPPPGSRGNVKALRQERGRDRIGQDAEIEKARETAR